jgi:hypothetical protein
MKEHHYATGRGYSPDCTYDVGVHRWVRDELRSMSSISSGGGLTTLHLSHEQNMSLTLSMFTAIQSTILMS